MIASLNFVREETGGHRGLQGEGRPVQRPCSCPCGRANGIQVGGRVWEGERGLRVTPFLEESSQTHEMQRRGCRRPFSRLDGCAVVLKAFHRSECCVACNREGPPRIARACCSSAGSSSVLLAAGVSGTPGGAPRPSPQAPGSAGGRAPGPGAA